MSEIKGQMIIPAPIKFVHNQKKIVLIFNCLQRNSVTQNTITSGVTELVARDLIFFDINWWAKNQKSP
jgi:hypothetical protein